MTPRVHLLIDATCATDRLTGFERYTRELCRALTPLCIQAGLRATLLLAKQSSWLTEANSLPDSIKLKCSPSDSRLFTEQVWIPQLIYRLRPSACFFPGFPPSPLVLYSHAKIMRTVYDGVMWNRPETLSLKAKLYLKPLETLGMAHYDVIHTISACSAKEIASVFPDAKDRIISSGIGTDVCRFQTALDDVQLKAVRQKYSLPERYLLTVGTIEPRKNLPFLLRVVARLKREMPSSRLVVAGRKGWGTETFMTTVKELDLARHVQLLGTVDDADLPSLYRAAAIFVFPSLHEGFGLPVVEAMASATPVIASNTTSIPEAAGEAAILLSPEDEAAWATAIKTLLDDAELAERLRAAGRAQAAKFSWDRVAKRVFESALRLMDVCALKGTP